MPRVMSARRKPPGPQQAQVDTIRQLHERMGPARWWTVDALAPHARLSPAYVRALLDRMTANGSAEKRAETFAEMADRVTGQRRLHAQRRRLMVYRAIIARVPQADSTGAA